MKKFVDVIAPEAGDRAAESSLVLMLSKGKNGCNLACDYCFSVCEGEDVVSFMTTETAIKAIDRYWEMFKLEKQTVSPVINYLGGEPLLSQKVIIESTEHIRRLDTERTGGKTTIVLNTNATLVTESFAKFAKKNNFLVIVSLDGPREVHNKHRKNHRGKGSYDEVVKGIKTLKDSGVEVTISTTLTPENFDDSDSLLKIIQELGIKEIFVGQLLGKGLGNYDINEYSRKAAVATIKYANNAKKFGIEELQTCTKDSREHSRVLGIDIGCPIVDSNQIVAYPNGTISVCKNMQELTKIGDLDTSMDDLRFAKWEMVEKLKQRLPAFNKECRGCELKAICGGGCAFSAKEITGDIMKRDPVSCEYSKELWNLRSLLNDKE